MARITPQRRNRIKRLARQNKRNRELINQLVAIRNQHPDITQADIASKMGVSQSQVSRFENYVFVPRLDQIRDYAAAIDHEVHFVVTPAQGPAYSLRGKVAASPSLELYNTEKNQAEAWMSQPLKV